MSKGVKGRREGSKKVAASPSNTLRWKWGLAFFFFFSAWVEHFSHSGVNLWGIFPASTFRQGNYGGDEIINVKL